MNIKLQSAVYRVTKGSFVNASTGEVLNYAKVWLLQNRKDTDKDIGLEIAPISVDYDKFDDLVNCYKTGTKLEFEIELKPNNGLLKPKVVNYTIIK